MGKDRGWEKAGVSREGIGKGKGTTPSGIFTTKWVVVSCVNRLV